MTDNFQGSIDSEELWEELYNALYDVVMNDKTSETKRLLEIALSSPYMAELQKEDVKAPEDLCFAFLGLAAQCNAPSTTKYLIDKCIGLGVDFNTVSTVHHTANGLLQTALYYNADKSAAVLIEAGADLSVRDGDGDTPLHYAVKKCAPVMRLMIEKGADINAVNNYNETPVTCVSSDVVEQEFVREFFDACLWFQKTKTSYHMKGDFNPEPFIKAYRDGLKEEKKKKEALLKKVLRKKRSPKRFPKPKNL